MRNTRILSGAVLLSICVVFSGCNEYKPTPQPEQPPTRERVLFNRQVEIENLLTMVTNADEGFALIEEWNKNADEFRPLAQIFCPPPYFETGDLPAPSIHIECMQRVKVLTTLKGNTNGS